VPCRISVFSGRKRERSPCEKPPNGDFGEFSHGDLSPRLAKIRQTVAENATWNVAYFRVAGRKVAMRKHEKLLIGGFSRGACPRFRLAGRQVATRKPATNGDFGGFSRGDLSPRQAIRQTGGEKATHEV